MDGVWSTTEIQSANDQECTICMVEISSFDNQDEPIARLSSCPHIFHANCLVKWRVIGSNGDLWPNCRVRMTVAEEVVAPVPPRRTAAGNALCHQAAHQNTILCSQATHQNTILCNQAGQQATILCNQATRTAGNTTLAQPRRTAGNRFTQHAARMAGELGRSVSTIKMSIVGKFIYKLVIGLTRRSSNTLRYYCTRSRCRRSLSTVKYWYTSSSRLEWNMFEVLMLALCSVLVYYLFYYSIELLLMGVAMLQKNIIYIAEALRNYVMPVTLVINFFGLVYFGYNRRLPASFRS